MSFRVNSAKTPIRSPNSKSLILRPKTGNTPRSFYFTVARRKPEKEELSQEKFVEQLTNDLDKALSSAAGQKEIFRLHQEAFAKLITRFELKNKAFTKVKSGYEEIMEKLQQIQKQNMVYQMSMRNISSSVQSEVLALQAKIQMKRQNLQDLLTNLDNLISDITEENENHTKDIEKLKSDNASIDMMNLDAQARFFELNSDHNKRKEKFENAKSKEIVLVQKEEDIQNEIQEQKRMTDVLIKELVEDNQKYDGLVKDVADLETEKKKLIEENENLTSKINEKTAQESLLQTQLDTLLKEIDEIRQREEKYTFDLSKIARQLHVPNKTVQNISSSYVSLLEACIQKYQI